MLRSKLVSFFALLFLAGSVIATNGTTSGSSSSEDENASNIPVTWKTYFFGLIVVIVFLSLMTSIAPVFSILCSAAVLLYLLGIVGDAELFAGMVNNGVLSIAMLYVIVHPVVDLPLMKLLIRKVLGSAIALPQHPTQVNSGANALSPEMLSLARWARLKVCLLSILTSSFLENTPQAAMFTPLVAEHCRKLGLAPSQILLPMNFAILMGNYFPLGFSVNLIVSGLMEKNGLGELPLFELAKVNLPLLIPILAYLVFSPRWLLPLRRGGITFFAKLKVTHTSALVGGTVSDVLKDFFAFRTEGLERVSIYRRSGSSTEVGKKLSWEKVREPFCRVMTIQPGDEIVISGLLATLGQSVSEPTSINTEMGTQAYISPSLNNPETDGEVNTVSTDASPPANTVTAAEEEIAARAAANQQQAFHKVLRWSQLKGGELESRLHSVLTTSARPSEATTLKQRSQSVAPTSTFTHQLDVETFRSTLRSLCQEMGVMMVSLKVCFEGSDLVKDDVAYMRCPNLVSTTRLLSFPTANSSPTTVEESSTPPSSPRSRPVDMTQESLLPKKSENDMTWSEWHQSQGGRMFRMPVPWWFPTGEQDATAELVPASASPQASDVTDPHLVAPANMFDDKEDEEKKKKKWKFVRLPWWYEYSSGFIFLGIVIASFFNVKLSISCFVGCVVCVVLRLVSTKELIKSLPIEIFLLVAFSFPLGSGMHESGLANALGRAMVEANVTGIRLLYLVGFITMVFANMITAQGSVQVIFPLVINVFSVQKIHPLPGIMMMTSMLSVALCTPFAVPSNAIVIVPGGYQPFDYVKFGLPLSILVWLLTGVVVAAVYDSW